MTKQELAAVCIARLKAEYPDSDCTLDYDHAWQLLVSVRLAAQCTDARVNVVVQDLFAKYPGVKELAAASPEEIEAIVKPCGLGHSKARDISACMRVLRDQYDCHVPDDFNALLALPGVELDGVHSGLHFLLTLPGAGGERAMVAAAAQQGVRLRGLSEYYLARPELCRPDTVVAGYSALREEDVEKVAQALARAWLCAPSDG